MGVTAAGRTDSADTVAWPDRLQVTVSDPDLDRDGRYATLLATLIGEVLT